MAKEPLRGKVEAKGDILDLLPNVLEIGAKFIWIWDIIASSQQQCMSIRAYSYSMLQLKTLA
ncbi:hypothetical protein E2562_003283 [Oryza meyeriana var. granulata]|uniref:Uncharacterized protein n=1 Tax=Oryza meyeriana var. granulata TaxID=110450 RepID=A0A6G1EE74_9ORYZ|nr:hypothetical protein E2562_003283 [Oryza meyeriana var. granulata]